jgi:UDP:flavonoid glycosyltransferase YjiC (YdhE family)
MTQGGALTTAAAFTAGRPQLVAPLHDEAELNFSLLEQNRVAVRLPLANDAHAIAAAIGAFIENHALADRAQEMARRIVMRPSPDGAEVAAAAVRDALQRL